MGIVELDCHLFRQVIQRTVLIQMVLQDIRYRCSREEILLAQAQDLAFGMIIVRVEDLGDQLGRSALADRGIVIACIKAAHVEARSLGLPQAQLGNALRAVPGNIHIIRHRDNAVVVFVFDMVEATVPRFNSLAVKADFLCLVRVRFDPDLTAGEPVIRGFLLPAVHNLLLEDAILIQDRITGAGDAVGCHAVKIAGRQASQTAVAQAGVRLLGVDIVNLNVGFRQHIACDILQPKVKQARTQAASHQELHAKVINLLFALAHRAGLELLLLVRHDLADNGRQTAVDLVFGCHIQGHAAFADQRVLKQLFKLFLGIFQQNSSLLYRLLALSCLQGKAPGRLLNALLGQFVAGCGSA